MYIERTHYYAKPGKRDTVLAIRRKACAVRVSIGIPAGSIFVKENPDGDGPDVAWECAFPTKADRDLDLKARADSPDFEAVREKMRSSIDRFERIFCERVPVDSNADWAKTVDLRGLPIVPREVRFQSGAHELAGFLYLPPGEGPFPCMITNHGSTVNQGSTDICRPSVAATLMGWGIASFLPHRRGYGNSPGPAWREEVPGEFGTEEYDTQLVARLQSESDDVLAALDYVVTVPEINAGRIGVMGSSFGGVMTLLAASRSDRLRCAVEFAGAAMNWERAHRLRDHLLDAATKVNQPIFFIQAGNDYSTAPTPELAEAARSAGATVRSRVFPDFGLSHDEGHFFERTGTMVWSEDVRGFLEAYL
jgi:dienelactone hydrolase